ncbi:hypothetical protein FTW19_17695 [Terriglobus albidus]|uniref:Phage tail protein n=1 Tax=Terriglobus albidus TaxID=1592106 RepID=A0A5B9EBV7_9BACT|nr:phage tail protein [Terriglobus albidus]QEE29658.1 hypothetical protein FTW19_17695 [Terriglobus albidus]
MTAQPERFLQNLPEIFHDNAQLNAFLRPLEAMLLGDTAALPTEGPGLREIIQSLPQKIDPHRTPDEFLPWLAGWLAVVLPDHLPSNRARMLIARAGQLFAYRGTRKGLTELLEIVTGGTAIVREPEIVTLTVGRQSVVGVSTYLGRDLPFYFEVTLTLPGKKTAAAETEQLEAGLQSMIDLAKPAHTRYKLEVTFVPETPSADLPKQIGA